MSEETWVLVDDVRDISADVVLRTYEEAKEYFSNPENPCTHLLMDNDLGNTDFYKDGYSILKKIILEHNLRPFCVMLVTANPVASVKMADLLKSVGYKASPSNKKFVWKS